MRRPKICQIYLRKSENFTILNTIKYVDGGGATDGPQRRFSKFLVNGSCNIKKYFPYFLMDFLPQICLVLVDQKTRNDLNCSNSLYHFEHAYNRVVTVHLEVFVAESSDVMRYILLTSNCCVRTILFFQIRGKDPPTAFVLTDCWYHDTFLRYVDQYLKLLSKAM